MREVEWCAMSISTSQQSTTLAIRPMTFEELELFVTFGPAFFCEFQLRGTFNPLHFLQTWQVFVGQLGATVLGLYTDEQLIGGLGALVSPDVFTGERVAT